MFRAPIGDPNLAIYQLWNVHISRIQSCIQCDSCRSQRWLLYGTSLKYDLRRLCHITPKSCFETMEQADSSFIMPSILQICRNIFCRLECLVVMICYASGCLGHREEGFKTRYFAFFVTIYIRPLWGHWSVVCHWMERPMVSILAWSSSVRTKK